MEILIFLSAVVLFFLVQVQKQFESFNKPAED